MNYFDKISIVENMLNDDVLKQKIHLYALLFDYTERIVLLNSSGKKIEESNPFRADFLGTRNLLNAKFIIKSVLYFFYRNSKSRRAHTQYNLLLSYNLIQRFFNLNLRLADGHKCFILMTKTNVMFSRRVSNVEIVKCDRIFYSRQIEKKLGLLTSLIRNAIEQKTAVDWLKHVELLEQLELELNSVTDKLAAILKSNGISQYITPFSNRYEEILICYACKKAEIVTKEICHGVNSQNLKNSDNVVPTYTDYLYVWNRQFYDNISSFEDMKRVRIGGYPKFSKEEAESFGQSFKTQPLITYFSQPTYDLGTRGNELITNEFIEAEALWRNELFEVLHNYSRENYVRIRVRYHQGEKGRSFGCDRSEEMKRLAVYGFTFSENQLEKDLFESALCLGVNTSVLYEAHVMGRNVLQTHFERTGDGNYHNTIPVVKLGDLKSAIAENIGLKKPIRVDSFMNLDDFLRIAEKK